TGVSGGSAAELIVSSGGLATGTGVDHTSVGAGGNRGLLISAGTAVGTTLNNSGTEFVFSGGTASATIINSGAFEIVAAGGTALATVISGGTEELAAGAIATSTITFAGTGGDLRIDGITSGSMPTAVISGLRPGDTVDLAAVGFDITSGSIKLKSGNVLEI